MKPSNFVEKHFTEGVLKDLEENMIGLSEDVKDARDLLESLETEEALLQLLIDYTRMLREGSESTIDKTLQVVRQACAMGDVLLYVQDFQEKVNAFKEKSRKLVQERAEQLKVETGEKSSPTSDLNWDSGVSNLKWSDSVLVFNPEQVNQAAMEAAREWGKTVEDRGKFSLRLFINMLENIVGPEADIDTETAEQALKQCKSVRHICGDIWMEVN